MSTKERVHVLQELGYTQREAAFLCIAALQSGYFLRRQFLSYIEGAYGKSDTNLTKKVLERGHAKATVLRYNQTLYHLCSKPLYTALGETDNRNRRQHFVFTVKARLMALDYVLQHRNATYLATEYEKVRHFRDTLGINCDYLPSKRYTAKSSGGETVRYFVDKYPISIAHGSVPVVRFCYIDEGLHSTSGFERYLDQYRELFARLTHFQLVYVAAFPDLFDVGRKLFSRRILPPEPAPVDPLVARLLAYFRTRQAYERRELTGFNQAKVIQFREDRVAFAGAAYEQLYSEWQSAGDRVVFQRFCPESSPQFTRTAEFVTHRLTFNYALFGTLANGNWRGE